MSEFARGRSKAIPAMAQASQNHATDPGNTPAERARQLVAALDDDAQRLEQGRLACQAAVEHNDLPAYNEAKHAWAARRGSFVQKLKLTERQLQHPSAELRTVVLEAKARAAAALAAKPPDAPTGIVRLEQESRVAAVVAKRPSGAIGAGMDRIEQEVLAVFASLSVADSGEFLKRWANKHPTDEIVQPLIHGWTPTRQQKLLAVVGSKGRLREARAREAAQEPQSTANAKAVSVAPQTETHHDETEATSAGDREHGSSLTSWMEVTRQRAEAKVKEAHITASRQALWRFLRVQSQAIAMSVGAMIEANARNWPAPSSRLLWAQPGTFSHQLAASLWPRIADHPESIYSFVHEAEVEEAYERYVVPLEAKRTGNFPEFEDAVAALFEAELLASIHRLGPQFDAMAGNGRARRAHCRR